MSRGLLLTNYYEVTKEALEEEESPAVIWRRIGGMLRRPLLLLLFFLSACARPDALPPQVGLTEPQGGGVAPGKSVLA